MLKVQTKANIRFVMLRNIVLSVHRPVQDEFIAYV
jgi:hypothetical protein